MSNTAPSTEPDTGSRTASEAELLLHFPKPCTLLFVHTIFMPRNPTFQEMLEIKEDWKHEKLGTSLKFLVMGKATDEYDCFQWAVQEFITGHWGLEEENYNDYQTAIRMLNKLGYELTSDASQATIDVWGIQSADGEVSEVTHFSLLTEFGWTSKFGEHLLVVHDRYDLEPLDDEGSDNGYYGGSDKEDYGTLEEEANVVSDEEAKPTSDKETNLASNEEVYDGSDEDDYDDSGFTHENKSTYGYVVAHFKKNADFPLQDFSISQVCMSARCDHADCDDFSENGCKLKWP